MRKFGWTAGLFLLAVAAGPGPVQACGCGRGGGGGAAPAWPDLAFQGGWQGYGPAGWQGAGPPGPAPWAGGGGPYGGLGGYGGYGLGPYAGFAGRIGPMPTDSSLVPPVAPLPAWRVLAGHADGFEYVMMTDPDEHPRATLVKVIAPLQARVFFDNRELKQGYDGIWRFAPKEPLMLHLPNVHTIRAVMNYEGQEYERSVTFRLQPHKLLKIRFD